MAQYNQHSTVYILMVLVLGKLTYTRNHILQIGIVIEQDIEKNLQVCSG